MQVGSKVKVTSGSVEAPSQYEGYYGVITAMGTEFATVTHSENFAGFQIPIAELVDDE